MKNHLLSIKHTLGFLMLVLLAVGFTTGCGSKSGGSEDPEECTDGVDCEFTVGDADGDGFTLGCDLNDNDATIVGVEVGGACDSDGDGHANAPCFDYDANDDGTLDNTGTPTTEYYDNRVCDNCETMPNEAQPNETQTDTNDDGVGDACQPCPLGDDLDGDSICDYDEDGDGEIDDNCIDSSLEGSIDDDDDGMPNACDDDDDNDGVLDDGDSSGVIGDNYCTGGVTTSCDDNCHATANADQADLDGDKLGDACDDDMDGDGIEAQGKTDICPDRGLSSTFYAYDDLNNNGKYDEGEDLYTDPDLPDSWDGCGYDTDGDSIYDHDEDPPSCAWIADDMDDDDECNGGSGGGRTVVTTPSYSRDEGYLFWRGTYLNTTSSNYQEVNIFKSYLSDLSFSSGQVSGEYTNYFTSAYAQEGNIYYSSVAYDKDTLKHTNKTKSITCSNEGGYCEVVDTIDLTNYDSTFPSDWVSNSKYKWHVLLSGFEFDVDDDNGNAMDPRDFEAKVYLVKGTDISSDPNNDHEVLGTNKLYVYFYVNFNGGTGDVLNYKAKIHYDIVAVDGNVWKYAGAEQTNLAESSIPVYDTNIPSSKNQTFVGLTHWGFNSTTDIECDNVKTISARMEVDTVTSGTATVNVAGGMNCDDTSRDPNQMHGILFFCTDSSVCQTDQGYFNYSSTDTVMTEVSFSPVTVDTSNSWGHF